MVTVKDIYDRIDALAPFRNQESYDNSGLNIGSRDAEVSKALIALDATADVVSDAEKLGVQLVITHHPVIFDPIKQIDLRSVQGRLARSGISLIAAHTSFDSAVMNDLLCEKLGLTPEKPLAVENGVPIGYFCTGVGLAPGELAKKVGQALGNTCVRFNDMGGVINRVAVCSGSGGSFLQEALAGKADCLITGDVKHNVFVDAFNAGITVIDAGHYHTEVIFCEYMQKKLSEEFRGVSFMTAPSERDILSYII
ncbi:dinuclear metal center protein, YbgI/SA1388 family [Ruminococcaceae bacterium FB2012]|nr:dinuclear metal center protein, YbgI/SA1388 family [Ruminococcaceae bacterium FB2012]